MSSLSFTFCQLSGMRNGSDPVARSKARDSRVKGSTILPFSFQPWTEPQLRRSVNVASG